MTKSGLKSHGSDLAKKYIFSPNLDAKLDATISKDSNATIVRIGPAGMPQKSIDFDYFL